MSYVPKTIAKHPLPTVLVEWLDGGQGRAAHFGRVDPILHAPIISKLRHGIIAVTFEYACRLERAQLASDKPFRAIDIMTYEQDRDLYRYVSGQEPAPDVPKIVRAQRRPAHTTAEAGA